MAEFYSFVNAKGVSIDINDGVNYHTLGRDNAGLPTPTIYRRQAPYQRGHTFVKSRYTARQLTLRMLMRGSDYADLLQRQTALAKVISSEIGEGILTVITEEGFTRALQCVYSGGLEYDGASKVGPFARRVSLVFEAADPTWYDPVITTTTFSGSGTGLVFPQTLPWTFVNSGASIGSPYTFEYTGTVESAPIFVLTGPMTNPVFEHVDPNGVTRFLKLNTSIPIGGTVEVDFRFGKKTTTLTAYNSTFDLNYTIAESSEYWNISEGWNTVMLSVEAPTPGGTATMSYYKRYLTI